jgi:hypothetical protein
VTRSALQNAASIAALFLTTEAVIADKPEGAVPHVGLRELTALLVELADLVGEAAVDDGGHGGHGRSGGVGGEDPGHGRPFRR